jgi:hypothetical protein
VHTNRIADKESRLGNRAAIVIIPSKMVGYMKIIYGTSQKDVNQ